MIDFRHKTFLTLCRLGSFTRAADELCLTQPAVSQHIHYLEQLYGGKLVVFEGKRFMLTGRGRQLYDFTLTLSADCLRMEEAVRSCGEGGKKLLFGATLSIGEYIMPPILRKIFAAFSDTAITMEVHNTQVLLQKLRDGELDFVLLEGFFDKSAYESHLFSLESFIAVTAPGLLSKKNPVFEDLFAQRLILREKGSGTRRVFEQILEERNYSPARFKSVCEIGNMSVIKQLAAAGEGLSFLYRAAARQELQAGHLCEIKIKNFKCEREFNFVFLKKSQFAAQYLTWFEYFKSCR